MTIASFSLPWNPSTVDISTPLNSASFAARRSRSVPTCALYGVMIPTSSAATAPDEIKSATIRIATAASPGLSLDAPSSSCLSSQSHPAVSTSCSAPNGAPDALRNVRPLASSDASNAPSYIAFDAQLRARGDVGVELKGASEAESKGVIGSSVVESEGPWTERNERRERESFGNGARRADAAARAGTSATN